MNLHDAVRGYLRKGMAPVPIEAGTKRPSRSLSKWQDLRLTEVDISSYFVDGGGVGILTGSASGGLCDVDLDCDEAVALAPRLLPPTPIWSGRDSRPRSHAWYRCNPVPRAARFQAPDSACLAELRTDRQQTVVYPSVHPHGDRYRWWGNGNPPAEIDGEVLEKAVRELAVAALLARTWPRERGSRHDLANALAGFLARAGWEEDAVGHFVRQVAESARDEEAVEREQTARATVKKFKGGGAVTGTRRIAEILGEAIVRSITEWIGLARTAAPESEHSNTPLWPKALGEPAYSGLAGQFVRLIEPHTEADPAALLVQFLAGFGNVVGRGPHLGVEADRHYANLFACLVGLSSKGRKGTAWNHVRARLGPLDGEWAMHRQQGGLSSGEGLIWAVRNAICSRSPIRQKGRVTGYEDVESDPGVTDKRLLVFEPEFASTLRVMCRDGSTLSATMRQAWDTGELGVLTKTSPAKATGAHISVIAHVTADELRRYLDRTELGNGFANRFLWICAKRSKVLPEGGRLDQVDFVAFSEKLSDALSFARGLGEPELKMDVAARELWHGTYPRLSEGRPGLLGTVISRGEAQVLRIALIYALLDSSSVIRRTHLEAGLEVWRYAERSAEFIFGDALGDPVADELLAVLRRAGTKGMSRAEISDFFGRNRNARELGRVLALLDQQGLARAEREETGGRPAERWFATRLNERNEENEERSDASPGPAAIEPEISRLLRTADADSVKAHKTNKAEVEDGAGFDFSRYGLRPQDWEVVNTVSDEAGAGPDGHQ